MPRTFTSGSAENQQPNPDVTPLSSLGHGENRTNATTLDIARRALHAFRAPAIPRTGNSTSGTSASIRIFITATERLIGCLEEQKGGELPDAATRGDVQAALRAALEVAERTVRVDENGFANRLTRQDAYGPRAHGLHRNFGNRPNRMRQSSNRLSSQERMLLISCSRRIESHTQVAVYRSRSGGGATKDGNEPSGSGSTPRLVEESGQSENGKLRRKLSFVRKPSKGVLTVSTSTVTATGSGTSLAEVEKSTLPTQIQCPWMIDPNTSPIVPLRERTLLNTPDCASVPCIWNGERAVVKVLRGSFDRLKAEAGFLWGLGQQENIQRMLGAYYEPGELGNGNKRPGPKRNQNSGRTTVSSSGTGYIVLEYMKGASLDKCVRENQLRDGVVQVRILEKVISTLIFVSSSSPPAAHLRLHPGNILLVPDDPIGQKKEIQEESLQERRSTGIRIDQGERKTSESGFENSVDSSGPDRTLRISNHTVKVLEFGNPNEVGFALDKSDHKSRSVASKLARKFSFYVAPEIRARKQLCPDAITTRGNENRSVAMGTGESSHDVGGTAGETIPLQSKSDVWSLGWLMYYMLTGKHPEEDEFDCNFGDNREEEQEILSEKLKKHLTHAPLQIQDMVLGCAMYDPNRRPALRDLRREIVKNFESMVFSKGVSLIGSSLRKGMAMMDKSISIKAPKSSLHRDWEEMSCAMFVNPVGLTVSQRTQLQGSVDDAPQLLKKYPSDRPMRRKALGMRGWTEKFLAVLPLVIVRRVEWETAAKRMNLANSELNSIRRVLVNHAWSKGDVKDGPTALNYLEKRDKDTPGRNAAALSAMGWIYRWGAGGVQKSVSKAIEMWKLAVNLGDAEAANGLGLLYHHGRSGIAVNGQLARSYYEKAMRSGYAAAAINLGVMLHDGAAGLAIDGPGARECYQLARSLGDAVASSNLGLLYQFGVEGVPPNGCAAREQFELAIGRGELNHARRNLAELLWEGAPGIERNPELAIQNLVIAVVEGDSFSSGIAKTKLREMLGSPNSNSISTNTRTQAIAVFRKTSKDLACVR